MRWAVIDIMRTISAGEASYTDTGKVRHSIYTCTIIQTSSGDAVIVIQLTVPTLNIKMAQHE